MTLPPERARIFGWFERPGQEAPTYDPPHNAPCPVCGKNKGFRERVYGRKPKRMALRYIELTDFDTYDHCIG